MTEPGAFSTSQPPPPRPPRAFRARLRHLLPWWPLAPLLLVTAYYVAQAVWVFPTRLLTPYSVSVVESQTVAGALRVARGDVLYQDFRNSHPVLPLTYMALTYQTPGWTARALGMAGGPRVGESREDRFPDGAALAVARIGRGLSLVSLLGIVALLTALASQRGVAPRWGWLAALPLLWFPYPAEWFAKFSPDAPALLFSLLGWWLARPPMKPLGQNVGTGDGAGVAEALGKREGGEKGRWREVGQDDRERGGGEECVGFGTGASATRARLLSLWRWVAVLAAWLVAFHFKPNVLVGPIAFGVERLWVVLGRRGTPKRALRELIGVGVAFVALALASLAAIHLATGGAWFDCFVRSTAAFRYAPAFVWENLRQLQPEVLASFSVLGIWIALLIRGTPLSLAFVAVLAFVLLLMWKQGGNVNYLLEPIALGGLALAAGLFAAPERNREAGRETTAAAEGGRGGRCACFGLWRLWPALPLAALLVIHPQNPRILYWEMFQPSTEELNTIDAALATRPTDEILCLESFYGLSRNLPILFADPFHAAILEHQGSVSFRPEIERLKRKEYKIVIWNLLQRNHVRYHGAPCYPEGLSMALEGHYRIAYQGNWLVVWVPR